MGEMLGFPEWLAITVFVVGGLAIWLVYGFWHIRKAHRSVRARRPNPTQQEFFSMMAGDCSPEVTLFLWNRALDYVEPRLTPHPDDQLFNDLKIDDDDVAMDWTREWAELRGLHESNYPDWPDGWPATIRNFGTWLDMAPV